MATFCLKVVGVLYMQLQDGRGWAHAARSAPATPHRDSSQRDYDIFIYLFIQLCPLPSIFAYILLLAAVILFYFSVSTFLFIFIFLFLGDIIITASQKCAPVARVAGARHGMASDMSTYRNLALKSLV